MAEGGSSAALSEPGESEQPLLRRGETTALAGPERAPLQFLFDRDSVSLEAAEVMDQIKQLAEKLLYHWKTFPINLPPPLTKQGEDDKSIINYRDLFQAPTFDELEQVASDPFGDLKKLSDTQLQSVWDSGEFDVPSINFPGQVHRWRLSQLFQKGSKNARNSLLNDSALALRLLIITARNRIYSSFFSLSESVKSWGRGLWKILDILIGLPSTSPADLETKIHWEHMMYLIAELDIKSNCRQGFKNFCEYVKARSRLSTAEKNKKVHVNLFKYSRRHGCWHSCGPFWWRKLEYPEKDERLLTSYLLPAGMEPRAVETVLRPPPIPYIYQTPTGQDIDLRLFNKDLINNCLPILSTILDREAKGWYISFRQKLLMDLKGHGLSTEDLSKRVNDAVKEEYLKRIYSAIINNAELENIEPGIGVLLVSQAKSVIAMQNATNTIQQKMQKHKAELLAHLKKAYPVKSRINAWVSEQLLAFEKEFVIRNLWSAHEEAIRLCEEEELHQAVYFLRRDLNFIKEREDILLKELSKVRIPNRLYTFSVRIWFPSNWVTLKTIDGEETVIPTVIAEKGRATGEAPNGVFYHVNKYSRHKTSTRYPMWRWWNYLHRSWAWMWNSIFFFGVVVPWCSPLSFRALLSLRAFQADYEISQRDGKLYPDYNSTTQTLVSRLVALWANVRKSRQEFEDAPDRGFIGKSMTRHFNRLWNYVIKGAIGSTLLVLCFPLMSVTVSTLSLVTAVTSPVWAPVITLLAHIFAVLFYDFDRPGDDVNNWLIFFEAIVWRWLVQGTIQPVAAVIVGFIGCPLMSLAIIIFGLTRRSCRGLWDTFMYQAVIKSRARVPARDSFVARRIAGPGLASNYFLQIHPEQALAALEASMELDELEAWKNNIMKTIEKPAENYRLFVKQVFKPFSADIIDDGVYGQLLTEISNYKTDVTNKVSKREWRLNTGLSYDVQKKIKLTEKQLKITILHAAKMMEAFYPDHVISQMSISEEDYWERKQLECRDWTGLASQKLSSIFSKSFLEPLEDTDNHFELKVQHVNLSRYIKMLDTAEFHDDLDLVTEVHSPTGDISTRAPHLDSGYFNPSQKIIQTHRYHTSKRRRFPWSRPMFQVEFDKLEVPLSVPHPAIIAISIYNREHEQYDLNFNDLFCRTLIKSIKTYRYRNIADPAMSDNNDPENSTPDNGIEPVSIISHLAEQEHSFSDDTTVTASPTSPWHSPTPMYERRVQMYMDDTEEDAESVYDNNEPETSSIVVDIVTHNDETEL